MTIALSVDAFAQSVRGGVLRAGDSEFESARHIWKTPSATPRMR